MTTPPATRGLTSFWHDLPREGRLLLSVVVLEFLGTGLVLPFLGSRIVLLSSLVLLIAVNLVSMLAETPPVAAVALTLSGAAFGVSWPAAQSLVAAAVVGYSQLNVRMDAAPAAAAVEPRAAIGACGG